jgi:hypothetical protein
MAVAACVRAFILTILCGNPILRGAFVTLLNSMILQVSLEIDLLTVQIARLNILNQILSLGITTAQAAFDKVKADLNLFLGPLQQFHGCVDLSTLNETIQNNAVGRAVANFNKKLYELNRVTNLVRVQNAIKQKKEEQVRKLQEMVDAIASLCG